jgi:RNA polymerase sigma factor (sigma-70 family)
MTARARGKKKGISLEAELALGRRVRAAGERALDVFERDLGPDAIAELRTAVATSTGHSAGVRLDHARRIAKAHPAGRGVSAAFAAADALAWELVANWESLLRRSAGVFAQRFSVDPDEYLTHARIGAFQAAHRYDPDRGLRFGTSMLWWVRSALGEALRQDRLVIRPRDVWQRAGSLHGLQAAGLTLAEAAAKLGVPLEAARLALQSETALSFDEPAGGDPESARLHEVLADEGAPDLDEIREMAQRAAWLRAAIARLPAADAHLLEQHFGLAERDAKAMGVLAGEVGLTRSRVHQLLTHAIAKLRRLLEEPSSQTVDLPEPAYGRRLPPPVLSLLQPTESSVHDDLPDVPPPPDRNIPEAKLCAFPDCGGGGSRDDGFCFRHATSLRWARALEEARFWTDEELRSFDAGVATSAEATAATAPDPAAESEVFAYLRAPRGVIYQAIKSGADLLARADELRTLAKGVYLLELRDENGFELAHLRPSAGIREDDLETMVWREVRESVRIGIERAIAKLEAQALGPFSGDADAVSR